MVDPRPMVETSTGEMPALATYLVNMEGEPIDMSSIGSGGGGGGTPLPPELLQAIEDALQGYQGALAARQAHSANLDEFATVDPSELAKQLIAATTQAAMLGIIGAQPASSALTYRIGQLEDFPNNALPTRADGWIPADGTTVHTIADDPRYAPFVAATGAGDNYFAGADVVVKDTANYTVPGKQSPLVYHGGKWVYYPQTGSTSAYPRSSPDLNVWTQAGSVNMYTVGGNLGIPYLAASFNGRVYVIFGSATSLSIMSSADGITSWSAPVNLSTQFNIGGAGGAASGIYPIALKVLENKLWLVGSSGSSGQTAPSFAASMDAAGVWTRHNTAPYSRPLLDVTRKPGGTILCPSYNGEVLCSDDEAATWQQYATGVTDTLQAAVWDGTRNQFYIGGLGGRLIRTPNGKNNYVKGLISLAITNVNDMVAVNGMIVAACTGSGLDGRGRVHYTRDGLNWDFKLVNLSETTTSVVKVTYNAGTFGFITNTIVAVGGGSNPWGVAANSAPVFDPGTQFFVGKAQPRAGGYSVFARLGL